MCIRWLRYEVLLSGQKSCFSVVLSIAKICQPQTKEYEQGALLEQYWHGKTAILAQKHNLLSLRPPKIPHRLAREMVPSFAKNGKVEAWCKILSVNTEEHRGRVRGMKSGQTNSEYKTRSLNSLMTTVLKVTPTSTSNRVVLQIRPLIWSAKLLRILSVSHRWQHPRWERHGVHAPATGKTLTLTLLVKYITAPRRVCFFRKTFTHFVVQDCRTL